MEFSEWKRKVWPLLSPEMRAAIHAEISSLRETGWSLHEAWVQAACTVYPITDTAA